MYVLSVLPVQDKDYPETPGIVTDETFSAVIVGLTGTKATQVILRGVTTVGSHLFVMTGAKPILHLGGRSNVKFNITVSPVVFSAGGGSFDPSQPATITGLWDLQNVSGINLVDEGPIILGKGDNAVKIHGSGTGSAVIEGANGATLDIAVPVDFSEPITMGQTLTVTGAINSNGGLNLADGQGIQFGTSIAMYSTGADFWLEGPANGKVGLNLPIEFPAPAEGTTLTDNMGVNVAMGDARYAKVVTTTKAAYTALTTKDPTTIYLITDTTPRMWAIGDMEIVTADMPA